MLSPCQDTLTCEVTTIIVKRSPHYYIPLAYKDQCRFLRLPVSNSVKDPIAGLIRIGISDLHKIGLGSAPLRLELILNYFRVHSSRLAWPRTCHCHLHQVTDRSNRLTEYRFTASIQARSYCNALHMPHTSN